MATDLDSAIRLARVDFATTVRQLAADQPPAVPEAQKLDVGGSRGRIYERADAPV